MASQEANAVTEDNRDNKAQESGEVCQDGRIGILKRGKFDPMTNYDLKIIGYLSTTSTKHTGYLVRVIPKQYQNAEDSGDSDEEVECREYAVTFKIMSNPEELRRVVAEYLYTVPTKEPFLPRYLNQKGEEYMKSPDRVEVTMISKLGIVKLEDKHVFVLNNKCVICTDGSLHKCWNVYITRQLNQFTWKGVDLYQGASLRNLVNAMCMYYVENRGAVLTTLGAVCCSFLYEFMLGKLKGTAGVPLPVLQGPPGTGKTSACLACLTVFQNSEAEAGDITYVALLRLCGQSMPFLIDDIADMGVLARAAVTLFQGAGRATSTGQMKPSVLPVCTTNRDVRRLSERERSRLAVIPFLEAPSDGRHAEYSELLLSMAEASKSIGVVVSIISEIGDNLINQELANEIGQLGLRGRILINYNILLNVTKTILTKLGMSKLYEEDVWPYFRDIIVPFIHPQSTKVGNKTEEAWEKVLNVLLKLKEEVTFVRWNYEPKCDCGNAISFIAQKGCDMCDVSVLELRRSVVMCKVGCAGKSVRNGTKYEYGHVHVGIKHLKQDMLRMYKDRMNDAEAGNSVVSPDHQTKQNLPNSANHDTDAGNNDDKYDADDIPQNNGEHDDAGNDAHAEPDIPQHNTEHDGTTPASYEKKRSLSPKDSTTKKRKRRAKIVWDPSSQ